MFTKVFSSQCIVKMVSSATFCRGVSFSLLHKFVFVAWWRWCHIYIEKTRNQLCIWKYAHGSHKFFILSKLNLIPYARFEKRTLCLAITRENFSFFLFHFFFFSAKREAFRSRTDTKSIPCSRSDTRIIASSSIISKIEIKTLCI